MLANERGIGDVGGGTRLRPDGWSMVAEDDSSDEDLMLRVADGDRAAFSTLSRRHAPRAVALARHMGCGPGEDEDVAQEALVRVWRAASRWDPDGGARFTTWFHRIVVNLCLDRRRRRPAHAPLDSVAEPESEEVPAPLKVQERQMAALLRRAMDSLPERHRAALALCYYEGCTASEAGKALGLSTGAVEQMLSRARKGLRERLARLGIAGMEDVR